MPAGRFVVMVGPDGVGKTSLAAALIERAGGSGLYFHFRPDRPPTKVVIDGPQHPKHRGTVSAPLGWLRIVVSGWRFRRGFQRFIAPALADGALVIGDRWAYGYIVQPHSLKFKGPQWLARLMVAALPQPDLVVNLYADPSIIRGRKAELSDQEIRTELAAWRDLPAPRVIHVSSDGSIEEMARRVEEALA